MKPQNLTVDTTRKYELKQEILAFILVILVILIAQVIVLYRGYVSASADEFSRILLAASWADSPYFIKSYVLDNTNAWQPWHFYLLGMAIKLFPGDLFITSRLVTMLFSFLSLGFLYLISRNLFNRWVGLIAVLIAGLMRTHINLSLTPMVDVIFITFLAGFLYYFLVWFDKQSDTYLLLSALMLAFSSGLRYDSWFVVAIFSGLMGIYWIIRTRATRSLQLTYLLSAGIACTPVLIWLWGNYHYLGNPFQFLARHRGSGVTISDIGPLTRFSRHFAIIEVLLLNWAYVAFLAVMGLVLSYRSLGKKLGLYLLLGFTPLVILVLNGGIGRAYRPHYPFPYLFLLVPFCAFTLYSFINFSEQIKSHFWKTEGSRILVLFSAFNLWLIYLRISHQHSFILIGVLIMAGISLSFFSLDRKTWFYMTLGLAPLMLLIFNSKLGLISIKPILLGGIISVMTALYYLYIIWRSPERMSPIPVSRWKVAGIGMLAILCIFNLYEAFFRIPKGMPDSAIQAGLAIREFFDNGTLSIGDKVLVEVVSKNYKGMQVMSNHPQSFILDRAAYRFIGSRQSFLLDKNASPHGVGVFYTDYRPQINPFLLDPESSIEEYFDNNGIRLIIIKDPKIDEIISRKTKFEKVKQIGAYRIFLADRNE